jgi:hypothetical protein
MVEIANVTDRQFSKMEGGHRAQRNSAVQRYR